MNVLTVLAREHRLFERLVSRLQQSGDMEPDAARMRIVESLLVLLPALERHDRIEDLVFGKRESDWEKEEVEARALVEAQHAGLKELRVEIETVLSSQRNATLPRLKCLAELLAERLKWHFQTEEMLLWPIQAKRRSRSMGRSIQKKAEQSVRDLEASVENLSKALRGYIAGVQ